MNIVVAALVIVAAPVIVAAAFVVVVVGGGGGGGGGVGIGVVCFDPSFVIICCSLGFGVHHTIELYSFWLTLSCYLDHL